MAWILAVAAGLITGLVGWSGTNVHISTVVPQNTKITQPVQLTTRVVDTKENRELVMEQQIVVDPKMGEVQGVVLKPDLSTRIKKLFGSEPDVYVCATAGQPNLENIPYPVCEETQIVDGSSRPVVTDTSLPCALPDVGVFKTAAGGWVQTEYQLVDKNCNSAETVAEVQKIVDRIEKQEIVQRVEVLITPAPGVIAVVSPVVVPTPIVVKTDVAGWTSENVPVCAGGNKLQFTGLAFTCVPDLTSSGSGNTYTAGVGISIAGFKIHNTGVLSLGDAGRDANTNDRGLLTAADWNTFNSKQNSLGTIPTCASGERLSWNGSAFVCLSTTGSGSVSSVGVSLPLFNIGTTITSSGYVTADLLGQNSNLVFAGPSSGGAASPTFRSLVTADLPANIPNIKLQNSSLSVNGGAGLTAGGSISLGSAISIGISAPTCGGGQVLSWNGTAFVCVTGGGSGTVTSVGISAPSIFVTSGSPVTTTGNLQIDLANQSANSVFAVPGSGGA